MLEDIPCQTPCNEGINNVNSNQRDGEIAVHYKIKEPMTKGFHIAEEIEQGGGNDEKAELEGIKGGKGLEQ
jgi:hypothetical protein